jgi:carbon-monoxide dehydrogenase large subunit
MIGAAAARSEGPDKVCGRALYAGDILLPNTLWAKAVRSPIAFGRITRLDTAKASALPGVHAVITGADVAGLLIGRKIYDMPILAQGKVRFIGEKVAAVAAETEAIAQAALDLIEVEYEEWPAVLDPLEASKPPAPLLHPELAAYRGLLHPIERPSNVFVDMTWKKGDVAAGFREADLIIENTFTTRPVHQAYLEPHACLVNAASARPAEIWACSKVPFALREQLAVAFHKPTDEFVVYPCYIGGCFGGKGDFMDVPVCYVLSQKTGRPVKMIMDYAEEFTAGNPRHAAIVKVKTGVTHDGSLVAHQIDFLFDSGAYAAFKPQGFLYGPQEAAGPYRIPHVSITERIVYTNKIPCGHMRAPGDPQGFFANESQMDLAARRLGMDPLDFRNKNLMHDGDISPIGHVVPHIRAEEIAAKTIRASGFRKPKAGQTGRGFAIAPWFPLGGEAHAVVKINEDGRATVATAMVDQGAGTYTALRQIVASELQLPLELVTFEILDTSRIASDTGVGASRATRIFGQATRLAAQDAFKKLLATASKVAAAGSDAIVPSGDGAFRTGCGKLFYGEAVKAAGAAIHGRGAYKDFTVGPQAALCAQVAEVEVDVETGHVRVKQLTTGHSTGTVINPLLHQGQIDGGIVMGMGYAVMEELDIEDGKVITASFGENKIPSIKDIPRLRTVIEEFRIGNGPYGAMSIGEPPVIPTAAAIANAVHDAVGVRIYDLPITAEKVLQAIKNRALSGERTDMAIRDRDGRSVPA